MREEHRTILRLQRVGLVTNIVLDSALWDWLRAERVVTAPQFEKIKLNHTQSEQIGLLLDHLTRCDDSAFDKLIKVLCETNQHHIVSQYLQTNSSEEPAHFPRANTYETHDVPDAAGYSLLDPSNQQRDSSHSHPSTSHIQRTHASSDTGKKSILKKENKVLIRNNREGLMEDMQLDTWVWKQLTDAGVITVQQASAIQEVHKREGERISAFLDHILRRPNEDFIAFCQVLNQSRQEHIVDAYLKPH